MFIYNLYICNKVIRIESECGRFIRFCRGYIIQEPAPEPDYTIQVSRSDINTQREMTNSYGIDMLEGFVILRKLSEYLLATERMLFVHGSVVVNNDSAYLFTAESGIGKTTHSRLWVSNLRDSYILNGDKPFISTRDQVIAWGSPWCGKEGYNRNRGVRLKAVCFLQRADHNSIAEISFDEALPMLAKQTGDPNIKQDRSKLFIMEGLYNLARNVKLYRFEMNNFADDAFITTYEVLSKID